MPTRKRFFASHAKSSAAIISLAIHAIFLVVALTFVAVTVIKKEETKWEAKQVTRPKMTLKRLQVPVNVKKQAPKPKIRKRIVVKPRVNQNMPDIRMPEVSGVKGGLGNAGGGGFGASGSVGFTMPEINIFGVKGKGEKIILVLDASADMMEDKRGGIPAYTIIKQELVRIVEELPPTALFNVLVFDWNNVAMAFPSLVPASDANAAQLKSWLMPLNGSVEQGFSGQVGLQTLGKGGSMYGDRNDLFIGPFKHVKQVGGSGKADVRQWFWPAMLAQKLQADSIFILTDDWDIQRVGTTTAGMSREEWDKTAAGIRWKEKYREGLKLLDEENAKRRAAGKDIKVLPRNEWSVNKEYFPDIEKPPHGTDYYYTPKDFAYAFELLRDAHGPQSIQTTSGIGKKRSSKSDSSVNIIIFTPKGQQASQGTEGNFKALTGLCNGQYKTIAGLEAIQSYVAKAD